MAHVDGTFTLFINDVDLQDVGAANGLRFVVEEMSGPTGLAPSIEASDIAGGVGAVQTSERGTYAARDFTVSIRVYGNVVDDVSRAFKLVRRFVNRGDVRIRTDFDVALEAAGRLTSDTEHYDQMAIFSGLLDLVFRLDDPLWYALTPTTLSLAPGERVRTPLGTGPSEITALIYGPSASPTELVYRNASGVEVSRLTLDIGLAVDEFARVSGDTATVVIVSAGVEGLVTDGLALLSPAAEFPVLDPLDALTDPLGAGAGDLWPTLEVTDLAGTATALVSYTQALA